MKYLELEKLMNEYKYLEAQSHISIDDILNKVNQEVSELLEACCDNSIDEMSYEAADVVVNILSVAVELGIKIQDVVKGEGGEECNPLFLAIQQGLWNQKIQAIRGRYSRENASMIDVQLATQQLLENVFNYTPLNLEEMIISNTHKLRSRQGKYREKIDLKDIISEYDNFPKKGINFKDISPILNSPELLRYTCMELAKECRSSDAIVGLDSRGFLFGTLVAEHLGKPFIMARKAGKIPGDTTQKAYGLEYGKDVLEMQNDSIQPGQKISIIDDLLATGGTVGAAIDLIERLGGEVNNISFVISLNEEGLINLDSRKNLSQYNTNSVVNYD